MRRHAGYRVLTFRKRSAIRRGGQRLPQWGEKWLYVAMRDVWLLVRWKSRRGYVPVALLDAHGPMHPAIETWGHPDETMPIKKRVPDGHMPVVPALSVDTAVFKKLPLVMEFLAATAYEDGTMRTPGYYTMRNRLVEYELTFYDPDAGMRLVIRHREHDKCWFGAEVLLGAADAPWEVDR